MSARHQLTLSPDVIAVLRRATVTENTVTFENVSRSLYESVDAVLKVLGGKWNRSKRCHVFGADPRAKLAAALAAGQLEDRKAKLQFFPTPPDVAKVLVDMADIDDGDRVLEPSAGQGALIREIKRWYRRLKGVQVAAVEIDPENCDVLRGYVGDSIAEVVEADFLTCTPERLGTFDAIVMNPPFNGGADVEHVAHAWTSFLKPGGTLAAIVSPAFRFRRGAQFEVVRQLLAEHGESVEVGAGAFKESGTNVATVMIVLRKPSAAEAAA